MSEASTSAAPHVEIIEQPSRGTRFRYKSESFLSAILGENSTDIKKSYPTIRIVNYKGPAVVVVSCVTKNPPFYPHPHNLVGRAEEVSNGICCLKSHSQDMIVTFMNLGIQCVKQKDFERSLAIRKRMKVDPFKTGFDHVNNPESIDLYSLRLCFQVFVEGREKGNFNVPLPPVVSEPINEKRSKAEPVINYMSHTSGPVTGGTVMCVLGERVTRDDMRVMFFDEEHNWEAVAELVPPKVFKKISIVFKAPPYARRDIESPVTVNIKLLRISDNEESEPFKFIFLPSSEFKRKRKRADVISLAERIQAEAEKYMALKRFTTQVYNKLPEVNSRELPVFLQRPADSETSASVGGDCKKQNQTPVRRLTTECQPVDEENRQRSESTDTLNSDHWIKDMFDSISQNHVAPWGVSIKSPHEAGTSFIPDHTNSYHSNRGTSGFSTPTLQQNGAFLQNRHFQDPIGHQSTANQPGVANHQEYQATKHQFSASNDLRSNSRPNCMVYPNQNLQSLHIPNQYDNISIYNHLLNHEHINYNSTQSQNWNIK